MDNTWQARPRYLMPWQLARAYQYQLRVSYKRACWFVFKKLLGV